MGSSFIHAVYSAVYVSVIVLLGSCVALRTMQQSQGVPCGEFLPDTDLFGADLPGLGLPNNPTVNDTKDACLDLCLRIPGCDAFTWLPLPKTTGLVSQCFLKDYVGQEAIDLPGGVAYILCPDEKNDLAPSPAEAEAIPCGNFIDHKDLNGWNLPNSLQQASSPQECLDICSSTTNCNAFTFYGKGKHSISGACHLKNVPEDAGAMDMAFYTSYHVCDAEVATGTQQSEASIPCGQFIENKELSGWNLLDFPEVAYSAQQCVGICLSTENCNAMTWRDTGEYGQLPHCYPKNVPADFEAMDRLYYSTYRMCDEEVATSTEQPAAAEGDQENQGLEAGPSGVNNGQTSQSETSSSRPALVYSLSAAGAAVLLIVLAALFIVLRRRRLARSSTKRLSNIGASSSARTAAAGSAGLQTSTGMHASGTGRKHHSSSSLVALPMLHAHSESDVSYTRTTATTTQGTSRIYEAPSEEASKLEKMAFLEQQLDSLGTEQAFSERLVLSGSGPFERMQGGQAMVQVARDEVNHVEYACKFFLSRAAFDTEAAIYTTGIGPDAPNLSHFLPQVRHVLPNDDQALKDRFGHPLPPCIVMERGEGLDVWLGRARTDRPLAFGIIYHVAERVKELHALGLVHRDLKPGNVMWLPRQNRWTIIDFGCAARANASAPVAYSLGYAAPEVVAAVRKGHKQIYVSAALDAWSVGVLAFELLTGGQALQPFLGKQEVMNEIEGLDGQQLPWEGDNLTADVRSKLGIFRTSILKLLERDPERRLGLEDFCISCSRILTASSA